VAQQAFIDKLVADNSLVTRGGLGIRTKTPNLCNALRVCVEGGAYDVMVANVGFVGEKDREFRSDTSYWRSRLCCGSVDDLKSFDFILVFGRVQNFDLGGDWFVADFLWHRLVQYRRANTVTVGPYSNGYTKMFDGCTLWEMAIGKVRKRHNKHHVARDERSEELARGCRGEGATFFAAQRASAQPTVCYLCFSLFII
jgi:hypothetical protein